MVKTATAPTTNFDFDADLFDGVDELMGESTSLPFAQIISPPRGLSVNQIEKMPNCYGLAVTLENAERVNFKPDSNWAKIEYEFSSETKEIWITQKPKFVIAIRSPQLVTYSDGGNTRTELAYAAANVLSEAGRKAKDKVEGYDSYTKLAIILLGEDNQPLHDDFLSLKVHGGFSVSLGKTRDYVYKSVLDSMKSKGLTNKNNLGTLSNFVIFNLGLGAYKSNKAESSPFVSVTSASIAVTAPTEPQIVEDSKTTPPRKTTLNGVPLTHMLVTQKTNPVVFERINQIREEYPTFGYKAAEALEETDFKGKGVLDLSNVAYDKDGSVHTILKTDSGELSMILSSSREDISDILENDGKTFKVEGKLKGSTLYPSLVLMVEEVDYDEIPF